VITHADSCAAAKITAKEICVDGHEGAAACFGDSGGPALGRIAGNRWVLLGVASRGGEQTGEAPCAGPTAYTNVTKYSDWIRPALSHRQPQRPRYVASGAADRFMRLR
jgi:secreted trypsin-like serine protease